MEFKAWFKKFKSTGLESFGRYYGCYKGTVYDNQDPEFRGRLRVSVPDIYGDDSPDYWALSKGMFAGKGTGLYAIPVNNDPIWVSFEGGDPNFPIWEYGWIPSNTTPDVAKKTGNTTYVFQTTQGQRLEFDDAKGEVRIKNKKGSLVVLNEKGVFVGNDKGNLFKFLNDLFDLFDQTTVSTMLGPQQFINKPQYAALKLKLKDFLNDSM